MRRLGPWVVGLVLVFGFTARAGAQALYRYVDPAGNVHFVDSPAKVPAAQRAKAKEVDTSEDAPVTSVPTPKATSPASSRATAEAPPPAKPASACVLVFRNRRSRVEGTKTIYAGEVMNAGTGLARSIKVEFVDYDKSEKVLARREVTPIPATIGPREAGSFEIEMKTVERSKVTDQVTFDHSSFLASFTRCD